MLKSQLPPVLYFTQYSKKKKRPQQQGQFQPSSHTYVQCPFSLIGFIFEDGTQCLVLQGAECCGPNLTSYFSRAHMYCKCFEARALSTFQDLVGSLWQTRSSLRMFSFLWWIFFILKNTSPYHNSEMKILLQTSGISAFPFYSGIYWKNYKFTYQSMASFIVKSMYLSPTNRHLLKQLLALQTAAVLEVAAVISVAYVSQSKVLLFASFLILVPCTSRNNRLNPKLLVTPKQLHKQHNLFEHLTLSLLF